MAEAMKAKAFVFDVDGTLIDGNSWQQLNISLGVSPEEDARLFHEYHQQRAFSYQGWVDRIVEIYKREGPVHRRRVYEVLGAYTLMPGAKQVIAALREKGYLVGIASAGLAEVVYAVAAELDIYEDCVFFNSAVVFDDQGYLNEIIVRGEDNTIKVEDVIRLCKLWQISPSDCVYVGDSYSDAGVFTLTGRGITFADQRCHMLHNHPCCIAKIDQLTDLLSIF